MIAQATELKPGDLLLLKKDKDLVHDYLQENYGSIVEKVLTSITGQEYLHSEIYLGEGWVLSAAVTGVKLSKYSSKTLIENFDIFRPKFRVDHVGLINSVKDNHNKRYDFTSLYLNVVDTITSLFGVKFEFPYDTKYAVICSELAARIYEDMGVNFYEKAEYITPQDLADSNLFEKI